MFGSTNMVLKVYVGFTMTRYYALCQVVEPPPEMANISFGRSVVKIKLAVLQDMAVGQRLKQNKKNWNPGKWTPELKPALQFPPGGFSLTQMICRRPMGVGGASLALKLKSRTLQQICRAARGTLCKSWGGALAPATSDTTGFLVRPGRGLRVFSKSQKVNNGYESQKGTT